MLSSSPSRSQSVTPCVILPYGKTRREQKQDVSSQAESICTRSVSALVVPERGLHSAPSSVHGSPL